MNQGPATQTLADLYASHRGKVSDKWTIYLKVYEELFRPYRASKLRLLEIGIQNGGSLEIWSRYFESAAVLVGCDINVACTQLRYDDPRVHVVVGDANTDHAERAIAVYAERFDLIIDDGSHRSSDIIRSFVRYFPRLEQGGIFVVEDLHCSYWQEFEGGLVDPWSSVSFLKRLADVINHEHWGKPYRRAEVLRSFESRYGAALDEESLAQIHSIEFYNSVCVIRKRAREDNELGPRVVVGTDAITAAQLMAQHGALAVADAQNANAWSVLPPLPEDELLELRSRQKDWLQTEAELRVELEQLDARVGTKDQQLNHCQQELQLTQQQLRTTQTLVEECNGQLVALKDEVRAIRASASWRVTLPMRKLADFLRRG
ncbi:class I SAM-dependent methyltransferase [Variovorax sp. OV700]|uniref:class I SAM-dependent methyltransferase n=1 Tax=Variovorax sp. OV700 TaxID=1882826 RepID=UPI001C31D64A|nr:class I SAM-dependent methyltransferase [Variovorax sp. OV700]